MNEGQSLEWYFGDMPDPLLAGLGEHNLLDTIVIAICGVRCGAAGIAIAAK